MKKGVRRMVVASMAALCALGASFSTSAYELNPGSQGCYTSSSRSIYRRCLDI